MDKKGSSVERIKNPDKILSYFRHEMPVLFIVTVAGMIYNIGMTAGPYFEGQLVQKLFDVTKGTANSFSMLKLCLAYIGAIGMIQTARTFKRFYVRRFANDININMRRMIYNSMIFKDRTGFVWESVGTMITKMIADVDDCVEGMRKFTTEVFDTGIVLVAYFVMLLIYDVRLALLCCIFPPIAYVIAEKLKTVVYKYNKRYKQQTEWLNNITNDRVSGEMLYRIFGMEKEEDREYLVTLKEYEKAAVKANVWENAMSPIYLVVSSVSVIFILYFGSKNVCGTGWRQWDIAAFTTFLSCFTKLAVKSSKAAKLFNAVQRASVSWKRIKPFMEKYHEVEPEEMQIVVQELQVEQVSFSYPKAKKIFENGSFHAKSGEIIGVTGPVASGKSTFGKLFLNEYPYLGHILLDGRELNAMSEREYNERISYMGHQPELMSASIKENVCLGDEVDLWKWLSFVCLDQEVREMPEKEETVIGEGGVRLSGGQQARLALARTLSHAKSVIILDDPFSALDRKTEQEIMEHLMELRKDHIIFIISHRLELFSKFEKVIWINQEKMVVGTQEELMENNPEYSQLFSLQRGTVNHGKD